MAWWRVLDAPPVRRYRAPMSTKKLALSAGAMAVACGLMLAYAVGRAHAYDIPLTNTLTYTGSLLTFGAPDNSSHQMMVALYVTGQTSTTAACQTATSSVTCVNGQFTIALPSNCVTIIHDNPNVEAELTIDGIPMGLVALGAVPYAVEADTASNAAPGSNLATAFVPQSATTGAASLPTGTTAQRPGSPAIGMMRMNTTTGCIEAAYNNNWTNVTCLNTYTVNVLVVAGGGGGGTAEASTQAGGGGRRRRRVRDHDPDRDAGHGVFRGGRRGRARRPNRQREHRRGQRREQLVVQRRRRDGRRRRRSI